MSTGTRFLIYGAGGHGKVVADVGRASGLKLVGFIDDALEREGSLFLGVPVVSWSSFVDRRFDWRGNVVALGIGENSARQRCFEKLRSSSVDVATLIHPSAVLAPGVRLGSGTVVMALVAINPDAEVGEGSILNTGSVVEHDCRLGHFVHLSPNAALGGAVHIGDRSHLGIGSVALPGLRIGTDVVVGAGAVVIDDIPDRTTVVGVPARPIDARRGGKGPS